MKSSQSNSNLQLPDSYFARSFLVAIVQQKLMLHNRSHATALNCHGQKYAIFESVDGDKKEPTDGAT